MHKLRDMQSLCSQHEDSTHKGHNCQCEQRGRGGVTYAQCNNSITLRGSLNGSKGAACHVMGRAGDPEKAGWPHNQPLQRLATVVMPANMRFHYLATQQAANGRFNEGKPRLTNPLKLY